MTSLARWHSAGHRLGWALAFLVGVLAAPSPARASCGDYVRMGDSGHRPAAGDRHDTPPAGPCHGPHCDRHRDAPLAPSAPLPGPGEDWACVAAGSDPASHGPGYPILPEGASRAVRRAAAIFHPPRAPGASIPA